jgi:hypothetical protein
MPRSLDNYPRLSPLQTAIYETDLLGLNLRDSIRLVTARLGFFIGQHRYQQERIKIARFIEQYGAPATSALDPAEAPKGAPHQIGSP